MGLVADIQAADIELRRQILEHRLSRFTSAQVPQDVVEFLARTINRNVRELVGGLNKLIAFAQLTGQQVSLQLAEEQLTDILSANRRRITIDEIQRTVCQFYRVDRSEMASKRRARRGASASGGDVPGQGAHPALLSGNRPQVWRARPLHRSTPCA
jgi:chromosomal replication initiator protein